jgi:hypothetical protein
MTFKLLSLSSVSVWRRTVLSLDRQWICAANNFVSQVDCALQQWRNQGAQLLVVVSASTELIKPLPNCPGFSESHQAGSFCCEVLTHVLVWQEAGVAVPYKSEIELSFFRPTTMKRGH